MGLSYEKRFKRHLEFLATAIVLPLFVVSQIIEASFSNDYKHLWVIIAILALEVGLWVIKYLNKESLEVYQKKITEILLISYIIGLLFYVKGSLLYYVLATILLFFLKFLIVRKSK